MLALISAITIMVSSPRPFYTYLHKPDKSYSYSLSGKNQYTMVSQTWKGAAWTHTVDIRYPSHTAKSGVAILIITGGRVNDADIKTAQSLADHAQLPVATLFDIPNQPISGHHEDDLIAFTFEKFLETGDAEWPLLFPMAKSALRAMDMIVSATAKTINPLKKFVVTGASKRGWTTWFVGAAQDKRVIGISPMVIDNLNVTKQMVHQKELWGEYSEMIADYTNRDLQNKTNSGRGPLLSLLIDPYSYRSDIKVPTLIVNGANDRYWATDALSLYWNDLRQPKSVVYIPNKGHSACDSEEALATFGSFANVLATGKKWPSLSWTFEDGKLRVLASSVKADAARLWVAESDTLDFRSSKWEVSKVVNLPASEYALALPESKKNVAFFGQLTFSTPTGTVNLCTQTFIVGK